MNEQAKPITREEIRQRRLANLGHLTLLEIRYPKAERAEAESALRERLEKLDKQLMKESAK